MLIPMRQTLKSGLTLIKVPMAGVSSVTTLVLGNVGSRYETAAEQGIAHFLEHMVFKGTELYPEAADIAEAIDALGAHANAYTGKEYTGYYIKAASAHLSRALDIVSDMVLRPRLRDEDIARERGVIIEEINMYYDTPMQHVGNLFEQLMFAGSSLEHDIIGTKQTVSQLNSADFHRFLSHWYQPSRLTIILAGDAERLGQTDLETQVEAAFAKPPVALPSAEVVPPVWSPRPGPYGSEKMRLEQRQTEQAHLILGWPGITHTDDRRYALVILSNLLGGTMSSRLFSEVREKRGLCYYVHADSDEYHDGGVIAAAAGVDPKRAKEAIAVIREEVTALAEGKKPVTALELERARDNTMGSLTLTLEDSKSVAQFFGFRHLLRSDLETPEELFAKLRAVTLAEVQAVAQLLQPADQMRAAVVGPFASLSELGL